MGKRWFVRAFKAGEAKALLTLERGKDARVSRRAMMIRLSSEPMTTGQLAALLGVSIPTVIHTIRAFNAGGVAALADKPRSGRPPRAGAAYVACLKKAVAKSPRDFGYVFSCWTLERLREHLARQCKVILSAGYLARFMHKHGIVYRRPRHVMAHLQNRQDYDEKKELLEFLKKTPLPSSPSSNSSTSMSVKFISTRP